MIFNYQEVLKKNKMESVTSWKVTVPHLLFGHSLPHRQKKKGKRIPLHTLVGNQTSEESGSQKTCCWSFWVVQSWVPWSWRINRRKDIAEGPLLIWHYEWEAERESFLSLPLSPFCFNHFSLGWVMVRFACISIFGAPIKILFVHFNFHFLLIMHRNTIDLYIFQTCNLVKLNY